MLNLYSGDHKSQAELAGIRAARAEYASRYSLCPKKDFWKVRSDFSPQELPAKRDPEESIKLIKDQAKILSNKQAGSIGDARKLLRDNGFIDRENAVCYDTL